MNGAVSNAIADLEAALSKMPDDMRVRVDLAKAYVAAGRLDEGVALFVEVAEHHVSNEAPFYGIAGYRRVLGVHPGHPTARERIADLYAFLGHHDRSLEELLVALDERRAAGDEEAADRLAAKAAAHPGARSDGTA